MHKWPRLKLVSKLDGLESMLGKFEDSIALPLAGVSYPYRTPEGQAASK